MRYMKASEHGCSLLRSMAPQELKLNIRSVLFEFYRLADAVGKTQAFKLGRMASSLDVTNVVSSGVYTVKMVNGRGDSVLLGFVLQNLKRMGRGVGQSIYKSDYNNLAI